MLESEKSLALDEYQDFAQDVLRASYQTFENNLRRFLGVLELGTPLGNATGECLPKVSFDTWYEVAESTIGSMVGSGHLDWPASTPERVAFQLELLKRIASTKIDWIDFCHNFLYAGNYHDDNLNALLNQIFLPFSRDFLRIIQKALATVPASKTAEAEFDTASVPPSQEHFVDLRRLEELQSLKSPAFDLSRLIRLCEELNICSSQGCYHAVAILTRTLLDHVPPIFGFTSFTQVANNYSGSRSFKELAQYLENAARKIADSHLHTQVRPSEVLPTRTQVNVSQPLDAILAEIVRILRSPLGDVA